MYHGILVFLHFSVDSWRELDENVQSKTAWVEIIAPTLMKAILKFCATNKLFEFKNALILKIPAKFAIFQHTNIF